MEDVDAVLAEAGRLAADVIAPLNRVGDTLRRDVQGRRRHHRAGLERRLSRLAHGRLERRSPRPPNGAARRLPQVVNAACIEMWNSASHGVRASARC